MPLRSTFHLTLFALLLSSTLVGQVKDSTVILQILRQAALVDSIDLAKEKYETVYTLASQIEYENGIMASLEGLIPIALAQNNMANALRYLLEKREILEKRNDVSKLVQVNTQIGDLYNSVSLYKEAITYYKSAEGILDVTNYKEVKVLYEKLGFNYVQVLKPDSAKIYYLAVMKLPGQDEAYQLSTLRKLVSAYQKANDYESSLVYNLQIKNLMEASPARKDELGVIYNNLGYTNNFLFKYQQAIQWFEQAEDYFAEDHERLAALYTNLGVAHFNKGNTSLALQYLLKALSLTDKTDHLGKGSINNVLANIYLHKNDYFNAQNFNRNAIQSAKQSNDPKLRSEVYETAAEIHSRLFEYEAANKAFKIHKALQDSMFLAARLEQDRLYQKTIQLGETEKQIKLLLIRGEIQELTIEQLELEKERQKLEIDNLNLAAQQRENDLEILRQSEEIREAKLENQELETQRTKQELLLVQGRLEIQEQERQLDELAQAEALAQSELEKKEALLVQEEQRRTLLEKEQEIQQKTTLAAQRIGLLLFLISLMILAGLVYSRRTNKKLGRQKLEIEEEQQKSESLLLNILPYSIAQELKENGKTIPRKYESVSIFFSDFVNFTRISAQSTPEEIIAELNDCFMGFDAIMEAEGIEKIQTIGDGYLAVGGLPEELPDHAVRCVSASKKIIAFLEERNRTSSIQWQVRIGIHSGAITAGVVGTKKFAYNIFGDTVNTASRLETASEKGRINVSAATYELIKHQFECEYRGKISAKGKGDLDMYFVI
ncbi:MAG: tetratricopeptide repeat protein [Saprospiraceae bacterium]|nr:tetratricopeptide repeat protein [Saprospiraceae bacterium]